jgi:hypothetical protein
MFGFQRRIVFFFDHGTLWPKLGPLAQISHTAATGVLLMRFVELFRGGASPHRDARVRTGQPHKRIR